MFTSVQSFAAGWSNETAATQRVMNALTDASLRQSVGPELRTLGQLAWHVATSGYEMLARTGLQLPPLPGDEHTPAPNSAQAIAETYGSMSKKLLEAVQSQWTDADLLRTSEMYGGEAWANGLTLHVLIQHEVHHRGQMTVLMRQAGLRTPDIYGPTREDWIEQGMQPLL
ncbi:DinB family protein [Paenibacillus konkukensis]|uniref:DinB family protein n=1 Tax=Paenibacillus konkukensis TaxID=2020716 RepID=A0ABY4RPN2_9BACL|nr:DinB family protein [Paenibacillus konkukensis]UQZ84143.1 DinB family protein [Paenibacillus konkukensis]